ncbi:MAG: (2E,6E)-farnesyl diphosphate synthase [Chromatiales bacterium]|nr:(2E,6E)-farnesyl diphosphate synthase [Chromatiales bacterium]
MSLKPLLDEYRKRVDGALLRWLPEENSLPEQLHNAMRYAVLGGGKRVRPVLTYATGSALGVDLSRLDGPACAVEMIHAYSLVHDDLPAMDDDELRRGRPTCHIAFDEATAILAGDALLTMAFEVLTSDENMAVSAEQRVKMIRELSLASGNRGMVGGQAIDIAAEGTRLTLEQLQQMHAHKTGALIRAAVRLGALTCNTLTKTQKDALDSYADAIGLAFQIRDDILDVEADTETLGKPQGSDAARDKPTYTSLLGLDGAREKAQGLHQVALESLSQFDEAADPLRWISAYIVDRSN